MRILILEVVKILPKFQINLPKEVRELMEAKIGDQVLIIETEEGLLLRKVEKNV